MTPTRNTRVTICPYGQKGAGWASASDSPRGIVRRARICDSRILSHTQTVANVATDETTRKIRSGIGSENPRRPRWPAAG